MDLCMDSSAHTHLTCPVLLPRSVAQHDLWQFRNESGLIEWQREEVEALGDQIQHRIRALQNPEDCESAKKILCNIPVAPKVSLRDTVVGRLHTVSQEQG